MRIVAIIPARAGSKRVKYKNLRSLGDRPLIEWTIGAAQASKLITDIYVSTDSQNIEDIAIEQGVIPINRPPALCSDTSPSEDAIRHVLNHQGACQQPDIIVMMQCTSPFRFIGQIDRGIKKLIDTKADSLFFGAPLEHWIWTNDGAAPINYDYKRRGMTQQKQWELVECGDYVFTYKSFMKHNNRLGGKIEHCIVDKLCSFEIDTKNDFKIAETLSKLDIRYYEESLA